MTIHGKNISFGQMICLALYYGFARFLPESKKCFGIGGKLRYALCRHIFRKCGKHVNIERMAWFASGLNIEIGDYSGLGINCHVPNDLIIGKYVMMGPDCYILEMNHQTQDTTRPMYMQGHAERKQTVIGNDVWIGREVLMTPGRHIADGSIIAARCVLCKDFPEYSIIGGNPSRLIKSRLQQ